MLNDHHFNTNSFFAGGGGMFIQYHDIIKPAYLYAIMKLIIADEKYDLPIDIISNMSIMSILEWYKNRRYKNPLKQLDWNDQIDINELDSLLSYILSQDYTIYKLAPMLNIDRIFSVYKLQHMNFPIMIYSEEYEEGIEKDCKYSLIGLQYTYTYGNLKDSIAKCDENFTYIFSDIELVKDAASILKGTFSHILLARDYRYNFIDNFNTMKYDLKTIMSSTPFIRTGTTLAMDISRMPPDSFKNIIKEGE